MSKSCKGLLQELVKCVLDTDCYQKSKDAKGCLKVEECAKFRNAYFSCKRSQVDMRSRIRGNKGY